MSANPKHLGKYELQERLGQGGMAEVWKGFDPQLKRYVAIKFLHANLRSDPDFVSRFQREGQAIAALRHPNIVQVYDFQVSASDDDDHMAYMVMDYIEGDTLADYLRRTSYVHKFPSAGEIVRLFTPISLAIDYAHRQRMIHRDIKPANILLDTRNTIHNTMGEPILTDFGIVKMLGTATITSTGTSMGTPLYISPEQVQGQPGNERSDIYALGVMLYEICTGEPLYRGDTPYAIMAQHVSNNPIAPSQRNPQLSAEVDEVILCCLAKDPQARFSKAAAMTAALATALNIPVPDQIRHSISSFNLDIQGPPSNPSHSLLPLLETNPVIAPEHLDSLSVVDNETSLPEQEGETALSDSPSAASLALNSKPQQVLPSGEIYVSPPKTLSSDGLIMPPTIIAPPNAIPASPLVPQTLPDRRRNRRLIMSVLLLIVLIGGFTGGLFLLIHNLGASATPSIVGTAAFFSSSQPDGHGSPSINDGIQVHLNHVPAPTSGNRYYAWLRDSQVETASVSLGILKVDNREATLSYTDPQHRDLLAQMSNFLVTEESANFVPGNPSLDNTQWRYNADLPQKPSSIDNFSYLDHIRHLLSGEPALAHLNLQNGVDFWLLNNTEEMYKTSVEAKDHSNIQEVRQLITNVLYYLDGKCALQDLNGASGNKTPDNPRATSISLLDCVQMTDPPGHLTHVALHLNGIVKAPGASTQEIKLAAQINSDLNPIRTWMQNMRTDALQLAQMDDQHLGEAHALRSDLVVQASYVIGGRVDPTTQAIQPSVGQICNEISLLANFEVVPYKAA